MKTVGAAEPTVEFSMPSPAADAGSGPEFEISDSPPRSRRGPGTDPIATGEFLLGPTRARIRSASPIPNVRPTMGDGGDRSIRAGPRRSRT